MNNSADDTEVSCLDRTVCCVLWTELSIIPELRLLLSACPQGVLQGQQRVDLLVSLMVGCLCQWAHPETRPLALSHPVKDAACLLSSLVRMYELQTLVGLTLARYISLAMPDDNLRRVSCVVTRQHKQTL